MLEGFVPFPPEFARRYRERGYWQDRSLAQEFAAVFEKYSPRTALVDGERRWTYAELDAASDNLALNLLDLGLEPLDRVVPTLPNVAEFVILYFALQKLGCIPIAALVTHRYAEISQFVRLSQARCCVYPQSTGDFRFAPMVERVQAENPSLELRLVLGEAGPGEHSLVELIERPATRPVESLRAIAIDPADPCIFQLSGGTTGIPKLIPRTGNDYAYNSKVAAEVAGVTADSVLLLGAADRAQPAARLPRHPGLPVQRRQGGTARQHPAGRDVRAYRAAPRHASEGRSGAAHPSHQRPVGGGFRPVVGAADPERWPAHAARGAAAHARAVPQRLRAGELRHVRRAADVRPPGRRRGSAAGDLRPAGLRRRRGEADRRRRRRGDRWRSRRAGLPRPVHAARLLRRARVQRAPVHRRRLLSIGRPDAAASERQLRGRGPQEGSHQPRRREDQRRGSGEPHPDASRGTERRLRADARRRCSASGCAPAWC